MKKLQESKLTEFKGRFRGQVLLPPDEGYDGARRIWNGMFDRRPAVIARCIGTSDVAAAVDFARENSLLVGVLRGTLIQRY